MAALGDKVAARRIAIETGVPVVPGVDTGDLGGARKFAAEAGFPILVKAAAGGGGRGMRVVADAAGLEPALEAAAREAQAAFGDGRVFLEKYLRVPVTSKFRFSATIMERWSHSASANARSSAAIRKSSKSRRRRDYRRRCGIEWSKRR